MSFRVYVAGAFLAKQDVESVESDLSGLSQRVEICSNWRYRENGGNDYIQHQANADADFRELRRADCLVAIINRYNYEYRGTFTELGFARALNIPVLVLTEPDFDDYNEGYKLKGANNVFFWATGVIICTSLSEMLKEILYLLKETQ